MKLPESKLNQAEEDRQAFVIQPLRIHGIKKKLEKA